MGQIHRHRRKQASVPGRRRRRRPAVLDTDTLAAGLIVAAARSLARGEQDAERTARRATDASTHGVVARRLAPAAILTTLLLLLLLLLALLLLWLEAPPLGTTGRSRRSGDSAANGAARG